MRTSFFAHGQLPTRVRINIVNFSLLFFRYYLLNFYIIKFIATVSSYISSRAALVMVSSLASPSFLRETANVQFDPQSKTTTLGFSYQPANSWRCAGGLGNDPVHPMRQSLLVRPRRTDSQRRTRRPQRVNCRPSDTAIRNDRDSDQPGKWPVGNRAHQRPWPLYQRTGYRCDKGCGERTWLPAAGDCACADYRNRIQEWQIASE